MKEYSIEIYKEIWDIFVVISISISKIINTKCRRNYIAKTFHSSKCFTLKFKIPAIEQRDV